MGRYYEGDIDGKFWFGTQSSDDGEFFGAKQQEPQFVEYIIRDTEIDGVYEGVAKCKIALGKHLTLFNKAYDGSLEKDAEWAKLDKPRQKELYAWFARLDMGMKILIHFMENPDQDCCFTAEF